MNLMRYLLEANLYLVTFYLLYLLLLQKETYYQLSRVYLLTASTLAFIIPLVQLGFLKPHNDTVATVIAAPGNITISNVQAIQQVAIAPQVPTWSVTDYLFMVYVIITIGFIINLSIKIFRLVMLSKKNTIHATTDFKLVEIESENAAFSFFSYLFIDTKLASSSTIIQHEQVHIRQKHSWDIIYLELIKIVNWFNPFVYLLQNSIKELHEFIADEQTAQLENSNDTYADFLISNAYGMAQGALTNSFSGKSMLRKRITMLYQKRSGKMAVLKYMLALPLIGGLLCLSTMAFTDKSYGIVDILPQHKQAAAHGVSTSFSYKNSSRATAKQNTLQLQKAMDVLNDAGDDAGDISAQQGVNDTVIVANKKPPLIVLDGKVLNPKGNDKFNFNTAEQKNYTELLGGISPNDIKDITVLKDSSATALYGSAGVNGVLIINTKKRVDVATLNEIVVASKRETNDAVKRDTTKGAVFLAVEVEPSPKEGLDNFYKFLASNIHYPEQDKKNMIQGRAIVQFIVEKDGSFSDVTVLRKPSETIADEALRVMSLAPKWNPGVQNGRPVRVKYTVPINFSLSNDDYKAVAAVNIRSDDAIYNTAETPPSPKGGLDAFYNFLSANIKYPAEDKKNNIQGRVIVQFVIEKDGSLSSFNVKRRPSGTLGNEALRVLQLAPNWVPATQAGKPVRVLYTIPINFSLGNN
ncbi:TonB family protein [Mucilaginibacter sp. HMF5004]|uniref:M56 family metallopeptidase n=1 Tax=Mucilaginibacter rivuli TaxID=2857527 RepID=UPI001C600DA3|nr:M56 family metallopeptidase [Mucilaginibacter rivuli]MBW4890733.1 TonB family protein [Mucilaginibacter rivuli]